MVREGDLHRVRHGAYVSGPLWESLSAADRRAPVWGNPLDEVHVTRSDGASGRRESVAETRLDYLCWAQHLPRPLPQVTVLDEHGQLFARVDFAWPEYGVFLEVDGREKYQRFRRENETLEEFLMREKAREERIWMLTGWICIRVSGADLENPVRTARRIRRILESRRPVGA